MSKILVTGCTTRPRLHKILNAAVDRLGLTEVAVVGDDWCDKHVTRWNDSRYLLWRYWEAKPEADIHLWFSGPTYGIEREIKC